MFLSMRALAQRFGDAMMDKTGVALPPMRQASNLSPEGGAGAPRAEGRTSAVSLPPLADVFSYVPPHAAFCNRGTVVGPTPSLPSISHVFPHIFRQPEGRFASTCAPEPMPNAVPLTKKQITDRRSDRKRQQELAFESDGLTPILGASGQHLTRKQVASQRAHERRKAELAFESDGVTPILGAPGRKYAGQHLTKRQADGQRSQRTREAELAYEADGKTPILGAPGTKYAGRHLTRRQASSQRYRTRRVELAISRRQRIPPAAAPETTRKVPVPLRPLLPRPAGA
jgi:hypothetical protein